MCPLGYNVASSARHNNLQISPLMSLIITLSARLLVYWSTHTTAKTNIYKCDNYGRFIGYDGYNSYCIMAYLTK